MKQVLFNLLLAFFISWGVANAATNTLHDKSLKTVPASTDETYVWDTGTSTLKKTTFAPFLVGDCTGFPCLDGTSDGGNYIKLWAGTGSYWTALQGGSPTANRSWRLPIAAPPAAGATYLMNMDEYGQMGFVDPDTLGGGAAAIDELTDVDTTGKATGKILKFDSSGNLVVGDDDTGSGSVPSGTVNGQVLLWATDQWVPSTAPWLTPALLSTENTWTAVQNFNSGLTATGLTQNLTSWDDWTFAGVQIVNASGTGENELWPANKVIAELAGKEPADSTIIKVSEIDSLVEFETLLGWNPGSGAVGGYVALSAAPYSDASCTTGQYGYYESTAYLCTGGFWRSKWTLTEHSNPTPNTYALTVDGSGWDGTTDSVTVGITTLTTDGTISGLSSATTPVTVATGAGRVAECSGTAITGAYPDYVADMSDSDEAMACSFSTSSTCMPITGPSTHTSGQALGSGTTNSYIGQYVTSGATDRAMCSRSMWYSSKVGDLTGHTAVMRVYTTDGAKKLTTLKAESTPITISGLTNGTMQKFTFASQVTVSATDAVVIYDASATSANYAAWGYATTDGDSGYSSFGRWGSDGALALNSSGYDFQYSDNQE